MIDADGRWAEDERHVKTFAEIDCVKEARNWAAPHADPAAPLDPLVGIDVDTVEGRKGALEKVGVLLFVQLVDAVAIPQEIVPEHPLVAGLCALYSHRDFGIDIQKRMGSRNIKLAHDATVDVGAKVQTIANAQTDSFSEQALLEAFAEELKRRAGTLAFDPARPFLEQYAADGTGCQRALCVTAVLEARGLLK